MHKGMNGPQAALENERLWNQWLKDVASGTKQWPMQDGKVIRSQLATDAYTGISRNALYGKLRKTVDAEIGRVEAQEQLLRQARTEAAQKEASGQDTDTAAASPDAPDHSTYVSNPAPTANETSDSRAVQRLREELAREQRVNNKLRQLLSEARAAERKAQAENQQYRHELESATTARRWWTGPVAQED